ncbi:MAG: 4-alpha-glucanotransferase [Syntrophobacteraceae bacterium]
MKTRQSGILLHITSLPSSTGIGDLGPGAYRFADFLAESGQSIWQILPLNPTSSICGNSPYSSYSTNAGNPLLISTDLMIQDGFLLPSDIENPPVFPDERVDFVSVIRFKYRLLRIAAERYWNNGDRSHEFERFCLENKHWLDDYALFMTLKEQFGGAAWNEWPQEARDRLEGAVEVWQEKLGERLFMEKFLQFVFFKQWSSLKKYSNDRNISIIGDVPIYVSYDSSDVWSNPGIFNLDEEKRPAYVAGVPPDYFSPTGQRWGNPVYRWNALRDTRYTWWIKRMEHNLKLFDMLRLDHFRGFVAYWEIPASEKTAVKGRWVEAPAKDYFNTLLKHFPYVPIIAEDLGIITSDVREIMSSYGFPGMKILQFAFGEDLSTNPYAPHNLTTDCLVYTGTHDNNTTRGWFVEELNDSDRERLFKYIGRRFGEDAVHLELMRLGMMSVSRIAVTPMQDILGLGPEARMNKPSVAYGNWEWRVRPEDLSPALARELFEISNLYGRA